jgi:hypothetical protein
MKPFKSLVAFLLTAITLISLTSCQKEVSFEPGYNGSNNGNGTGSTSSTGTFTAKINGGAWQAASDKQSATIIAGVINVTGISSNGQMIAISTMGDTVGTYELSNVPTESGACDYQPDYKTPAKNFTSNSSDDPANANGKLIITKIDTVNKIITGTFVAKVFNFMDGTSYNVTEGAFNLTYSTSIATNSGGSTSTGSNYLKATIDGTAWQAPSVTAFDVQGNIMINGTTTDISKTIGITVPDNIAVGTYTFSQFGTYMALYNVGTSITNIVSYASASGTLKITEHNTSTKKITGTFDFNGQTLLTTDSKQITAGSFSVTYQ